MTHFQQCICVAVSRRGRETKIFEKMSDEEWRLRTEQAEQKAAELEEKLVRLTALIDQTKPTKRWSGVKRARSRALVHVCCVQTGSVTRTASFACESRRAASYN
jgi:hypothetical protein